MKNKILLTLAISLLIVTVISGQSYNASKKSRDNSSTTLLDSAEVFTGTAEELRGYNSISIVVRADKNGTYKVLFGSSATITTATAIKTYSFTYTANDTTHTKYIPSDGTHFKVVYTNDTVAQTKFYLTTLLHQEQVIPSTIDGKVDIAGVDTTNQRIQEIKLDIDALKIYNAPATKYVGLTDTVTTRTDTTTVTGTWVEGEIKADDSCEVAINGAFTTGETFIITETTAVKLPKWAIATSDKLFVRRYGNAGTVRFYLRLNSY